MPQQAVSAAVLADRYLAPGESGRRDVFRRVAQALAAAEAPAERALASRRFYRNMLEGSIGAGRVMANAGTAHAATMVNCFVHPIGAADAVPDAAQIAAALADAAATLAMGGGVGYDFSSVAPAAAGGDGQARDVCRIVERFDASCERLSMAGTRRGAQMAVLRCDHPDLPAFVRAKRGRKRWRTFNVSVAVTDAFLRAVEADLPWALVHRAAPASHLMGAESRAADGRWRYAEMPARALWREIVDCARDSAEPGLLFLDTIRAADNLSEIETIAATNPCGEQPLPAWGSCVLGPVDLSRLVRCPFGIGGPPALDFVRLAARVRTQVRLLDNVLALTRWPLPQHASEASAKRRIGVGITGLADALAMLRLAYDTPAARQMAARIAMCLRDEAYAASAALAAQRGPYPLYDAAHHLAAGRFGAQLPASVREAVERHGLRNSHLLSFAPTGSVSLAFADNCSNGIEPAYDWVYRRAIRLGTAQPRIYQVENHGARLFRALTGSHAPLPDYFRNAAQVSPADQLAMLAALQPFVDAAISKTVMLSPESTTAEVEALFLDAWRAGLKGITVFRPDPALDAVFASEPAHARETRDAQAITITAPAVPPAPPCGTC
ncbi:adenosylcobalamin-dependent ribonucleoside-diphosphate reductase [Trinickia caryophylli]|uniref:Vitamin B12-dependent ribonucleotide reductase n=1 Tax=Trinickia caryophylli TaxID=28094 RepID=A0A1X7DX38_TRICW|nr:adenosylcobalamin-dependent ribonucleoside-diphosphate reductase [Trinickia caryophylli]PMS14187.1 ribonucleoside-diphosphate reductase, adenosylcobalamin-dependent [Trinickia caryophylli]TRX17886.1 adenosylcobalamin-dependent ribonucleoside-diphosphate reductase [Trinickia caryophylli]WQE11343.1 adenosylcobalamin-dependent ribonucleoside-diphosphate reductase [Trinickia caryophylli]SMF23420.1 ribonucleoside-diphosphate reductase class II [Trinickia caryophylli]